MDDKHKALEAIERLHTHLLRRLAYCGVTEDIYAIKAALTSGWQPIDPLAIATAKELTEQYAYHTKVHFVATALLNATPPTTNDGEG